jgi:hypothetical protein
VFARLYFLTHKQHELIQVTAQTAPGEQHGFDGNHLGGQHDHEDYTVGTRHQRGNRGCCILNPIVGSIE